MADFDNDMGFDEDTGLPVDMGYGDGNHDATRDIGAQQRSGDDGQGDADESDLSQPMFEYEKDGQRLTLTGNDLLSLIEQSQGQQQQGQQAQQQGDDPRDTQIRELLTRLNDLETRHAQYGQQSQQQQGQQDPHAASRQPLQEDPATFGRNVAAMLEGENGGIEALGQYMGQGMWTVALEAARHVLQEREQVQSFDQDFGIKQLLNDPDYQNFARQPRNYNLNAVESVLAYKHHKATQEVESLKQQIEQAKKQGVQQGEQQAVRNLKARGTLRSIQPGGSAARQVSQGNGSRNQGRNLADPDELNRAMLDRLIAMRSGQA